YTPLTGSRQFRVLLLHPGQDDDPISCSLEVETLWDGATFEALSYVWGGGDPKNRILLDGDSFLVRDNLFDALTRLRNDAQVRRLWVDAICINQDDVLERNSQVRLMTELYSAASKVLVWLGVDDQIASAFKAISEMRANAFRRLGQGHTDSYAKWDNRASYMLQNLYFERAWIFQEVVSSEGATIYCGSSYEDSVSGRRFPITDSLPWEDLTELYHALGEELLQKENPDTYISLIGPLCLAQNQRRSRKGHLFHLLPLLELRRNSKATDPRDKIYALLELSADGEGGRFPVDYRLSVAEVYTNAALFLIQSRKDLRVLSAVQHSEESRSDLPSWVPDWREPWKVKPLVFRPPTRPEVENTDRSLPNVGMMAKLELVTFQRGEFTSIDDTGTSFAAATGRPLELESSDNPAELRLKGTSFAKIRVVINFYNDILKVRSKNSANVVLT
ncbi:heterokaryon incompatibility protein-domain-containing protein, partial [Thelonectria olida]